mmetsp:Transcript_142794/g.455938  ORF Transcript_142794/g.455938 Transcript_142794/m.455938 type:complete len:436 (-) Transcript_142794:116-1423(-)
MFDFDDLASEDEAAEKPSPAPAPRGATIGQLPKAKAKVKAQATPRSRPAGPDLSELAAMENAHAAKMLAMMAPPLPTAPTPVAPTNCNAMPTPPVVTAPTLSAPASHHPQYVRPPPAHADQAAIAAAAAAAFRPPVRPSEQPPAATARSDHGRGGGGSSGGAMRSEVAAYEPEEVRRAREEEEVARAVAEAAVEHEIERGRRSAWWTRLEDNRTAAPLERCGDLRINNPANDAGATNSSNPLGLPTQEFVVETKALPIRAEPSSQAPVSGAKKLGERVHACEETFDGWVKLADEPGWIPRDAHCDESLSASLRGSASGKEQLPLLPVCECAGSRRRMRCSWACTVVESLCSRSRRPIMGGFASPMTRAGCQRWMSLGALASCRTSARKSCSSPRRVLPGKVRSREQAMQKRKRQLEQRRPKPPVEKPCERLRLLP